MKVPNTIMVDGRRLVCRIFDLGPDDAVDRYTIAFKGRRHPRHGMYYPYLAASDHPFHPQGFGQHGEAGNFLTGDDLGKRIAFEECPPDVQKFILQNI